MKNPSKKFPAPICPHDGAKAQQQGPAWLGVRRMRCTRCTRQFTQFAA